MTPMVTHYRQILVVAAVVLLSATSIQAAPIVNVLPGYDLFQTTDGTNLNGIPLQGVPLGSFNFGGTIGVQSVGNTDTIVQRLQTATPPSVPGTAPTISLQMLALQMETVTPVDLGAGLNNYFVTLQSVRGGPATTGTMDITFANSVGGTFNSFFDVFYDIRVGSLNGPIVNSADLTLTGTANTWSRTSPPLAVTINGANINLNGVNSNSDFWPTPPVTESHPGAGAHVVNDTLSVPEPSTFLLAVLAFGLLFALRPNRFAV
jgi:hypothetical protein